MMGRGYLTAIHAARQPWCMLAYRQKEAAWQNALDENV